MCCVNKLKAIIKYLKNKTVSFCLLHRKGGVWEGIKPWNLKALRRMSGKKNSTKCILHDGFGN